MTQAFQESTAVSEWAPRAHSDIRTAKQLFERLDLVALKDLLVDVSARLSGICLFVYLFVLAIAQWEYPIAIRPKLTLRVSTKLPLAIEVVDAGCIAQIILAFKSKSYLRRSVRGKVLAPRHIPCAGASYDGVPDK